eukprot:15462454-Alexandrium_andersonii.AAC.1
MSLDLWRTQASARERKRAQESAREHAITHEKAARAQQHTLTNNEQITCVSKTVGHIGSR